MDYYPKDKFSKDMLSSIPIKVKHWLDKMGKESIGASRFLNWHFDSTGGYLYHYSGDNKSGILIIRILWTQDGDKYECWGNQPEFEDVASNLDYFVSVENRIYSEIERLYEAEEAKNAVKIDLN